MPAGVVDAGARLPSHQIRRAARLLTRDCRTTFLEARQREHSVCGGAGHCLARPPRHLALLICTRCSLNMNWSSFMIIVARTIILQPKSFQNLGKRNDQNLVSTKVTKTV